MSDTGKPARWQDSAWSWWWITVLVIVSDQISKWWISSTFELYESVQVLPFFSLTLVHNEGAAFSFLSNAGGWQRWFLLGTAAAIAIGLTVWGRRVRRSFKVEAIPLALIVGGAIGNVIDRAYLGYVVDFIDVYYDLYGPHFPAFNIADSAISVGAAILVVGGFFVKDDET